MGWERVKKLKRGHNQHGRKESQSEMKQLIFHELDLLNQNKYKLICLYANMLIKDSKKIIQSCGFPILIFFCYYIFCIINIVNILELQKKWRHTLQ